MPHGLPRCLFCFSTLHQQGRLFLVVFGWRALTHHNILFYPSPFFSGLQCVPEVFWSILYTPQNGRLVHALLQGQDLSCPLCSLDAFQDPAQTSLLKSSLNSPREGWLYPAPDCSLNQSSLQSSVKKLVSISITSRDSTNLEDKEQILRQCMATSRCPIKINQPRWILIMGWDHWFKLCFKGLKLFQRICFAMSFVVYKIEVSGNGVGGMPMWNSNWCSLTDRY